MELTIVRHEKKQTESRLGFDIREIDHFHLLLLKSVFE